MDLTYGQILAEWVVGHRWPDTLIAISLEVLGKPDVCNTIGGRGEAEGLWEWLLVRDLSPFFFN